jgi:hypothetical protein
MFTTNSSYQARSYMTNPKIQKYYSDKLSPITNIATKYYPRVNTEMYLTILRYPQKYFICPQHKK